MTDTQTLDAGVVAEYLCDKIEGFSGPIEVEKFQVGQSNPTFLLKTPAKNFVLRRKPPGILLKSAHAVDREFRVQSALAGSDVPVAKYAATCEKSDEAHRAGQFYVMDFTCTGTVNQAMPDHAWMRINWPS